MVSDFSDLNLEPETLLAMMRASWRPLSSSLVLSARGSGHRAKLMLLEQTNADGLEMRAQVAPRPVGILVGLHATVNPLRSLPTYQPLDQRMSLAARAEALAEPERRQRLIAELTRAGVRLPLSRLYVLGEPPQYEPPASSSAETQAAAAGVPVIGWLIDALLADEGRALLYLPLLNYPDGTLDAVAEMLAHPYTVPMLFDGGAHVGTICDESFPTTLLTHWCRDRDRQRFDLPWAVQQQARATAEAVGLRDRGIIAPGFRPTSMSSTSNTCSCNRRASRWISRLEGADSSTAPTATCTPSSPGSRPRPTAPTGERPGRLVRHHRPDPS